MKKTLLILLFVVCAFIANAQQAPLQADPNVKIKLDPYKPTDTSAVNQSIIFTAVQQEPDFVGGREKFNLYIKQNLNYPDNARKDNIQGKVFLGFVVEIDGSISNIKVLRGISTECDIEAVRLLKSSPRWNPGLQNGHNVRVHYNIPVEFKL